MTNRVAINGYGRIGQSILRAAYERKVQDASKVSLNIVAINELSDIDTISYLTRFDTTHGRFPLNVEIASPHQLKVADDFISVYRNEALIDLPWANENIDLVMECTGVFNTREEVAQHILAGSSRVLLSQPADIHVDKTVVFGVNHTSLSFDDQVVSNASCTSNAIVPIIKALDSAFSIVHGTLNTIHSAMNDQPTIDAYHHRDLRRTRSAMNNMVPVETALAKGIERLLPNMKDKLTATAIRVPTINVSAIDLCVAVERSTTVEEVNLLLKENALLDDFGILAYTEEPLASSDFNHDTHSSIVDGSQTRVSGGKLIKVFTWFDNEWAFANRMLDVAEYWLALKA